ncbi:Uncharacterised protein [Sphingomonas paucimobilis]|nr:Uncharacterised protein [Sphingomonas paucimobilis]
MKGAAIVEFRKTLLGGIPADAVRPSPRAGFRTPPTRAKTDRPDRPAAQDRRPSDGRDRPQSDAKRRAAGPGGDRQRPAAPRTARSYRPWGTPLCRCPIPAKRRRTVQTDRKARPPVWRPERTPSDRSKIPIGRWRTLQARGQASPPSRSAGWRTIGSQRSSGSRRPWRTPGSGSRRPWRTPGRGFASRPPGRAALMRVIAGNMARSSTGGSQG